MPASSRSEEHTSELQSPYDLVCRLLLEKKNTHVACDVDNTQLKPVKQLTHDAKDKQVAEATAEGVALLSDDYAFDGQEVFFFFYKDGDPRDQHSFPTRRSSD